MLEPEPAARVGIVGDVGGDFIVLLVAGFVGPVLRLLVLAERVVLVVALAVPLRLPVLAVPVAVPVRAGLLDLGDDRRQSSRESVDLMLGELGAVAEQRALLGEDALEAEQQRELLAPLRRGLLEPLLDLEQRSVEGEPAGGAGMEVLERLTVEQDRLPRELLDAFEVGAG